MNPNLSPLMTFNQFAETYRWPTVSAMKMYAFRAKKYGLEDCFVRVGRRILVDPAKFFDLIRKVNNGST